MERFRINRGDLFQKGDTSYLADLLKQDICDTIKNLEDEYVLNVSENQYINYLIERYKIECPIVQFDKPVLDKKKMLVSVEYLPYQFKFAANEEIERTVYKLCIPFSGDAELLRYLPSTFNLGGWGYFVISGHEICMDILDNNNDGESVKRECQSNMKTLSDMIGYLKRDIERINQTMPQYIRQTFIGRKERIIKENDVVASIGIPLRSNNIPKTYSVPTVVRRFEKPIVYNPVEVKPLAPTMAEVVYQDILNAINTIGQNIERFPKTIENQDEETIREHFLTQLSTTFKSCSSTGESFNQVGKTDIMVKRGDDILFIAECKIWKGAKKLNEAIDQLLSYLTWRDSKTALLIFNKDTNVQTIVDSIQESIPCHPNFVKLVKKSSKGWFDFVFHLTNSPDELKMAVMVFDFHSHHTS